MDPIDPDAAWSAFTRRDRAFDDLFVVAVATTRIYCRPSCPARRPRREHVAFFADGAAARAAGYRGCRRCLPDEAARDRVAVDAALAVIAGGEAVSLDALAARVGYAPHHLHRLFKRATGLTPAGYARALRAGRVANALSEEGVVTDAIHDAGYGAPSRFYDGAAPRLGMAPSAWAKGGAGEAIRWTIVTTSLGPLLVAATAKGLCRVAFDEDEAALARRFPRATLEPGDAALDDLAARLVETVDRPGTGRDLPLDVRGTAFQERIWQALRAIPPGETRSYAELAAAAGNPRAVRAAGGACGANPVALAIPCHRARRGDGGPGGFAWGLDRKRALTTREQSADGEGVT